ncbi:MULTISPECIES: YcxB family protein [unclassified Bosea (in: a-proteobacteria)]|uniref:YcxB family protein n=1 Tax=unclassified Bosea (in: a-proteobacteria) TaxID=2653178 RepID=UPI000F7EC8B7|nr:MULTISPECIES: YcxB family protein [unclassified Bosea (in: a-proteobacteria)]
MNRRTTFTLDELDLRRAVRLHVFSAFREKKTLVRMVVLWGISMAVVVGLFLAAGTPWLTLHGHLLPLALVITATILGTSLGIPLALSPLVIRRRFKQEKLIRLPVSAGWDEEAYEAEQPGVRNRFAWRDYMKIREDRHLFLFFLSDYNYQILPKRALTPGQIEDLQRVLATV